MVRGLSGFGGSDILCEASGSDLNSFCCMLRTLVAMMRGERRRKREVVFKGAFIYSQFLLCHPFTLLTPLWMTSLVTLVF